MSVKVQIPLPLRGSTSGLSEVEARGSNIREIIGDLEASYPGIRERLFAPADLEAMARVRDAFNPTGLLCPGKVLPTDGQPPVEATVPVHGGAP